MSIWTRWRNSLKSATKKPRPLAGKTDARKRLARRMTVEQLEDRMLLSATVVTDKLDYAPGQTAIITGSDFQPGEVVQLQVLRTDGQPDYPEGNQPWQVRDGDN